MIKALLSLFPKRVLRITHRLHAVVRGICVNRIIKKLAVFDYSTKLSTLILVIMGKISGIRIVSGQEWVVESRDVPPFAWPQ